MAEGTSPGTLKSNSDPACCVEMLSSRVLCPMPYFPMGWWIWAQYCNGTAQMCIRTSLSIVRHWRDIYNFIRATQIVQKSWTLLLPHKPSQTLFSSRDFSREQTPLSCSPWSIFSGWLFWFGWFNLTAILEGGYKREYCVSIHRDTSKSSSTGRSTAQSREHKSLPSSNMAECDQCAITCN